MGFLSAKEARPVDDPSALVPFGWAPGGYYCAACSDCGQSHTGSDKRSRRCQDCAEALRDAKAKAPTQIAPMIAPIDEARLRELAARLRYVRRGEKITSFELRDIHDACAALDALSAERERVADMQRRLDLWEPKPTSGSSIAVSSRIGGNNAPLATQKAEGAE